MQKTLLIVESPAKAKTIGKYLGTKYIVKSSMGHIRDLPKSKLGVDVENEFEPHYINIRGKGGLIKELKTTAKKSSKILIATDPDREGEAIAWHLQAVLGLAEEDICRVEFHEVTKNAVIEAVKKPRKINMPRVNAQQGRRVLDRLVGYGLSPLLWKKIKKGLSAGRVQSLVVKIICDREKEIEDFVEKEYWTLDAEFLARDNQVIEAKLLKIDNKPVDITSTEEMQKYIKDIKLQKYEVTSIKNKERIKKSLPPFITSTLQQEANKRFNFSVKKTMSIAQQLYEGIDLGKKLGTHGLITYLRTDSTRISEDALKNVREFISANYGIDYLPKAANLYGKKKSAQDAHEAIRPTDILRLPVSVKESLTKDQYKLYQLIWERFLASQMNPALYDVTSIDVVGGEYLFRSVYSNLKFAGFTKVYQIKDDEEKTNSYKLVLEEGMEAKLDKLTEKQHFTQPPARYSEASLVKALEEMGIGRPSTYAPTIDTIVKRGYVIIRQKQLFPTELGLLVTNLLAGHFQEILNVEFTARMESSLDEIEETNVSWKGVLHSFYDDFAKELHKAEEEIGEIELKDEESDVICEKCGRKMVYKLSKYGKFLACPGFPDCRNTKPIIELIDSSCPICGSQIAKRKGKKGRIFYGCTDYPECAFVSWDEPSNEKCPKCNEYLVKKTTKSKLILKCSNSNCDYKHEEQRDDK